MKIKLLVCMGGPAGVFNMGDEYECGAEEAGRLVEAGFAELIREEKVERAVRKPKFEKAAK
jgi:hypothetical protein